MKVSDSAVKVSESASRDDTDEPLKEQPIDEIIAQILFEREYDENHCTLKIMSRSHLEKKNPQIFKGIHFP